MTGWLSRMRTVHVLTFARHLGFHVHGPRGSFAGALCCPACPCWASISPSGLGWQCAGCGAGGGAVDLAAYALRGVSYLALDRVGKRHVGIHCGAYLRSLQAPEVFVRRSSVRVPQSEVA